MRLFPNSNWIRSAYNQKSIVNRSDTTPRYRYDDDDKDYKETVCVYTMGFGFNFFTQSESLRTEEYHDVDGHRSQRVTDSSAADVIGERRQTSFFERNTGAYGVTDGLPQPSVVARPTRRHTAPRFVSAPQGRIAEQGEDVYLDAIVDSYPPSDITWSKNGGPALQSDGRKYIITDESNKTRLDIKRLAVNDGGQYTCKAVNAAGSTSCTTDVIVKSESRLIITPLPCRNNHRVPVKGSFTINLRAIRQLPELALVEDKWSECPE